MSNLLKSKFLLGLAIAAAVVVGGSHALAYSHTVTLKQGSTGTQVMSLQQTLNANGFLVATTGAGSPGMESSFFGTKTKAAVVAFQSAHSLKADGIVGLQTGTALAALTGGSVAYPAGCTSTTGFSTTTGLSCSTAMSFPAGCTSNSGYSTTTGNSCAMSTTLPAGCTSTSGFSSTTGASCSTGSSSTLSGNGETSISNVSVDNADDDSINEEATKAPVADIQFDVDDADAQLVRADVVFQLADGNTGEEHPWRAFDKVYLMDGSTVISSVDASDQNNWTKVDDINGNADNQAYRVRFSNINKVYKQDSNNNDLWVAVDVASSVNGSDSNEDNFDVGIDTDGLRFTDGAGVDTFVNSSDTASFSIEQAGAQSGFNVTEDDSSPDAQTLQVNATSSSTQTIAIFKAKADSDGGNVKLDDFPVSIAVTDSAGDDVGDLISDLYVVINGTTYSADQVPSTSVTPQVFTFGDIDDDNQVINSGQSILVTVKAKFKSQGTGPDYANGATIQASADLSSSDVEDSVTGDEIGGTFNGDADGEVMTLAGTGISVSPNSTSASLTSVDGSDNDFGTYTVKVDITAFHDDAYISQTGATAATVQFQNASTGAVLGAGDASSLTVSSTAPTSGSSYRISEGSTETFTFTMTYDPSSGDLGKSVRAQLLTIVSGDSAGTPTGHTFTVGASSLSDYRTTGVVIPD